MFTSLPGTSEEFAVLSWAQIEPWYRELLHSSLSQATLQPWMMQWSDLSALVDEAMIRLEIVCTQDTADEERVERKQRFREEIYAPVQSLDQQVKERLLASGLEPDAFALPLRNLRAEAALYREENLPLLNEDKALSDEYYQINGTQMVTWDGREAPITALYSVMNDPDRARREQAWRTMSERKFVDFGEARMQSGRRKCACDSKLHTMLGLKTFEPIAGGNCCVLITRQLTAGYCTRQLSR